MRATSLSESQKDFHRPFRIGGARERFAGAIDSEALRDEVRDPDAA